ncbi:hypothetical protein [Pendulispora albinea]|uniref:Aminopeptidase n=1 Tax=Pendulispora albinea TaxID=2741071 RepID=A0ABZ2M4C1_9BACT
MRLRQESNPEREKRPVDFGLLAPARRIIEELFGLGAGERLLLACDEPHEDFGDAFEEIAWQRGATVERVHADQIWGRPWRRCPRDLLDRLPGVHCTLLALRGEEREQDARADFVSAATAAAARHIQMIGVSRQALLATTSVPCIRIFKLLETLGARMKPTSRIVVRSDAGTDLAIEMAPHLRWYTNGMLLPGQWITVPYGALRTTPHLATGTYVADATVSGGLGEYRAGLLGLNRVRLTIDHGRVRSVDSRDERLQHQIQRFLAGGSNHDRIGAIILGANVGHIAPLGEQLHDENMPGLHLALGNPTPAKSGAPWMAHGQLVFASQTCDVDVDGHPIIRRGRYVEFL